MGAASLLPLHYRLSDCSIRHRQKCILTALNVVMVPFIAFIICKKKIGVKGIIGAVMAVVGVGILSLEKNLTLGLGMHSR